MAASGGARREGHGWTSRHRNIAGEIARLEAALGRERAALLKALDRGSRQALRLNLAVAHEELGALYRRLHALGTTDDVVVGMPLYVVERAAGDGAGGGGRLAV